MTEVQVTIANGDSAPVSMRTGVDWEFWDGPVGAGTLVESGSFSLGGASTIAAHDTRFDSEHTLLRHRALGTLAQIRSLDAMEDLSELALSPIEDESARAAALVAVERATPSVGTGMSLLLRDDKAHVVQTRARKFLALELGIGGVERRGGRRKTPPKDR